MTDFKDQISKNFDEWLKEKAFLGNHELYDSGDITRFYTGISYRGFNYIYKINEATQNISPIIETTVDFFKAREIPFLLCQDVANTNPERSPLLKDLGLEYAQQATGLAYDLSNFPANNDTIPGLKVEQVTHPGLLLRWLEVGTKAYGYSSKEGISLFEPLLNENSRTRLFLAYLNDKLVGSSMLFLGSESAGLYWDGVIPEARNRGVNTAMAQARLQLAKDMDYSTAVAQCFDSAVGLYKRLGFKEQSLIDFYRYIPQK